MTAAAALVAAAAAPVAVGTQRTSISVTNAVYLRWNDSS